MQEVSPVKLYKMREVGDILGVCHKDVQTLIETGALPAKRIRHNSRPRVAGQAILNFINATPKAAANG